MHFAIHSQLISRPISAYSVVEQPSLISWIDFRTGNYLNYCHEISREVFNCMHRNYRQRCPSFSIAKVSLDELLILWYLKIKVSCLSFAVYSMWVFGIFKTHLHMYIDLHKHICTLLFFKQELLHFPEVLKLDLSDIFQKLSGPLFCLKQVQNARG